MPRSALKIFRDDIIKRDRELGRRPKVASTEHWKAVKGEWDAMALERKRAYEDQASAEQDMIKARRKRQQLAGRARPPLAIEVGVPDLPAEQQPPRADRSCPGSTIYINQTLETSHVHSQLAEPAMPVVQMAASSASCYPLPEPLFAEYLRRTRGGIVKRCEGFKEDCQKMQGGSEFPKKVTYHLHCGALCSQTTAAYKVQFHKEIKTSFAQYVNKHFKTAMDVASSDVLFAIEICGKALADGSPATAVTFAAMTAAAGRRAQFEPEQTFVPCRVVVPAPDVETPYEGVLLEYITDTIETKARRPSNRVRDDRVLRQHDGWYINTLIYIYIYINKYQIICYRVNSGTKRSKNRSKSQKPSKILSKSTKVAK